jgi:C_GCAxxG_C_C family probable redox protein
MEVWMDRDAMIKRAYECGFDYERRYRGCAQSTVAAVQDTIGIRNDYVFKASGGFAAGCGMLRDGLCGGYSGGIMTMSTLFARRRPKFDNDREENYCSYRMAINLHDRFMEEYGSIICLDIHKKIFKISYDLWDPEEKQLFEEAGAHADKCTGVVAKASAWTVEILLDEIVKRRLTLCDFKHLLYISK